MFNVVARRRVAVVADLHSFRDRPASAYPGETVRENLALFVGQVDEDVAANDGRAGGDMAVWPHVGSLALSGAQMRIVHRMDTPAPDALD